MGHASVEAMLGALERYLARGKHADDQALARTYLKGVRDGWELAQKPSESADASNADSPAPLGFVVPPLEPPPKYIQGFSIDLGSGSSPDPKSIECASLRARETLELFPPKPELPPQRRRRFPEEFRLTPGLRRFAEAGGLDAAYEFGKFRDYYRGTGEPRCDWPACFRTWCRNAFERRAERGRR